MPKKTRKKKLWLVRCRCGCGDVYLHESVNEPMKDSDNCMAGVVLYSFCWRDFRRITGIKLKPGEVREVKSIKFELKGK